MASFARICSCFLRSLRWISTFASGSTHLVTSPPSLSLTETASNSNLSSAVCALSNAFNAVSLFYPPPEASQLHNLKLFFSLELSLLHVQYETDSGSSVQKQRRPYYFKAVALLVLPLSPPFPHVLPLGLKHRKPQG